MAHLCSEQATQAYGLALAALLPSALPPQPLPLPRVRANCYWVIFLPGGQGLLTLVHSFLASLTSREIW